MEFYKNLYIGDSIRKPNKVKRKLKRHAKQLKIYVIILSPGTDQLEIFHSILLGQPFYKKKENLPYIVGIAGNYDEAVELVCRIVNDAMAKNGNADLKNYIQGV